MRATGSIKRSWSALAILAVALLVASEGGSAARAASSPRSSEHASARDLTLTATDMHDATGKTFTIAGAPVTNAEVAMIERVSVLTMNRHRISGYQTTLAHRTTRGVELVADSVGLYKSAASAKWEYKLFTRENRPLFGSKTISMSGIGAQARGYTSAGSGSASVYLRRGVYTARIDISGFGSKAATIVRSLSRILDRRMRAS